MCFFALSRAAMATAVQPHQTRQVVNGVVFRSDFDSGNLKTVLETAPNQYQLTIATDGEYTGYPTPYRSWFHFAVHNVPKGRTVQFTITNMPNQARLFNTLKSRPVYRCAHGPSSCGWTRLRECLFREKSGKASLVWSFSFNDDSEVFFAFSYPYSFTDIQQYITDLQECVEKARHHPKGTSVPAFPYISSDRIHKVSAGVGVQTEILCESLEKRPVYMLRITEGCVSPNKALEKRVVFVTARVHPGETPAQFACMGFINFIVSTDPRAQALRRQFEIRVIPCLNPDGVALGYYRNNTRGLNLNRYYRDPSYEQHEGVFHAATMLKGLAKENRLVFYVDLHGHANKTGCFLYGNHVHDSARRSAIFDFARLMQMNSPFFELEQCNFTAENMAFADATRKFGEVEMSTSKQGSARVALFKDTGHLFCYTLECSFARIAHGRKIPPINGVINSMLDIEKPTQAEIRDGLAPSDWAQVGEAIAVSVLDMWGENRWSRRRK